MEVQLQQIGGGPGTDSPRPCTPYLVCTDVEPGTGIRYAYPVFKNLLVKSPIHTTTQRTFSVQGNITIGRRGSIEVLMATYRLCTAACTSPSYYRRLSPPISIRAGDKISFSIEVTEKHG